MAEAAVVAEDARHRRAREDAERSQQEKRKKEEKEMFDDNEPIAPLDAIFGPSSAPASPKPKLPPRRGPPQPTSRAASRGFARMPVRGASRGMNSVLSSATTPDGAQSRTQGPTYQPYSPDKYRPNKEHDDLGGLL